jgi:hypothetical protein
MPEHAAEGTADESRTASAAPPFRALDPELPGLAARAAFQLDNLRLRAEGKEVPEPKRDAIEKFATRLQRALTDLPPAADRKALLDPLTTSILHDAMVQAHHDQPRSMDTMLADVGCLTQQLIRIDGFQQELAGITMLRDFCLAISDLSSSKQRLVRSPRPPYHGPKTSRL